MTMNLSQKEEMQKKKTRRSLYKVNAKSKFQPINQGFCPYCWITVEVSNENKCKICHAKCQVKRVTYDTTVRRFEKFMDMNDDCIGEWIPTGPQDMQLKIPIQLGRKFYWVPVRYFAEFSSVKQTDQKTKENNPYVSFFEYLKSICEPVSDNSF